jgi:transcription elongation factor Elf1
MNCPHSPGSTHPTTKKRTITCPSCGSRDLVASLRKEPFEFLDGDAPVTLHADVDVFHCEECQLEFTDEVAEQSRKAAVAEHLG